LPHLHPRADLNDATLVAMNDTNNTTVAIFVIVLSVALFAKFPNTYPNMNTMLAMNSILSKMIPKNITRDLSCFKIFTKARSMFSATC
jgi:hypothetical protein